MKKKTANTKSVKVAGTVNPAAELLLSSEVLNLHPIARQRAYQAVNTELVTLYWQSENTSAASWSPPSGGIVWLTIWPHTSRNPARTSRFYAAQSLQDATVLRVLREHEMCRPLVTTLPWTHHLIIMGQCKREEEREFYIRWPSVNSGGKGNWNAGSVRLSSRRRSKSAKSVGVLAQSHPEALNIFKDSLLAWSFLALPIDHSETGPARCLNSKPGPFLTEMGRVSCFSVPKLSIQVGGQDSHSISSSSNGG